MQLRPFTKKPGRLYPPGFHCELLWIRDGVDGTRTRDLLNAIQVL